MGSILLLNATYEPLSILSLRRAAKLLIKERAEPVAGDSIPWLYLRLLRQAIFPF